MVPPVFLLISVLPWLLAGRCASAYWHTIADVLAEGDSDGGADVVALPSYPHMRRRLPHDHVADLIPLLPKRR